MRRRFGMVLGAATVVAVGAVALSQTPWAPPADRAYPWNPGIPGGIPNRTTVCTTLFPGATGPQIQSALDACPQEQVVMLAPGTYAVNTSVFVPTARTLRGSGPGQTIIAPTQPLNLAQAPLSTGLLWPSTTAGVNLMADATRGSVTLSLASTTGLAVGEIVLLDQVTDANLTKWGGNCPNVGDACRSWYSRPNRPIGEMLRITAVSGNTITFAEPLSIDYKVSSQAQVSRFTNNAGQLTPLPHHSGIEDLTVTNPSSNSKGGLEMNGSAYSWIKNVEVRNTLNDNVGVYWCYRCVVRDSYFHDSANPTPGGAGYAISIEADTSHSLFENNIAIRFNKVMVMRSAGAGNVVAYNYMDDGYIAGSPDWVETGLNAAHMAGTHHTLFEGNQAFNCDSDNTWGNAIYNTWFRNQCVGIRRNTVGGLTNGGNPRAVGVMEGHWWQTFAGNVLGRPGLTSVPMWKLGYDPTFGLPTDPKVLSTVIRDGNYEYIGGAITWTGPVMPLPDSLYLTSKPAFFGTAAWPWVDALGSTKLACLPARARYDGTTCGAVQPTPTASPTATPSPTPTATPSPTSTPSPTATPTSTPTPIPTATPTPCPSPTPCPICPSPSPIPTECWQLETGPNGLSVRKVPCTP